MNQIHTMAGRAARCALVLIAALGIAGCASVKMPAATASAASVEAARATPLAPSNVGGFKLAAGRDASLDTTLGGLRGSSLSPANGSFANQLKDQLLADLKAAGLLKEGAPILIEGELTSSMVDAAVGTGTGRLSARFVVTRAGKKVFDKELAVEATWESSFMGAVALPAAINQYTSFYPALTRKLFEDVQFRAALAP